MSDLFISEQHWVYAKGATLSEALHRLADALPEVVIPADHHPIYADTDKTRMVEIFYDDDPTDDDSYYRAGICVSWKRGT